MKKVVVLGAGASGLTAAILLKRRGIDVTLIEKNSQVGKKILVTGAGKCNYFNEDFRSCYFTSTDSEELDTFITEENIENTKQFLTSIGIVPKIKNGYYYPNSLKAVSVQNSLLTEIKNLGIPVLFDTTVLEIKQENHFILKTNKGEIEAEKLVVGVGSRAYFDDLEPDLILKSLKKLGHTITPTYPGLVQLKAKGNYFKEWAGIRTDVKLSLYHNDKLLKETVGEIQLTDYGISGICTLILSNTLIPLLQRENQFVFIHFLNSLNIQTIEEGKKFLKRRNKSLPNRTLDELLDTILDYKLTHLLLKLSGIPPHAKLEDISEEQLEAFIKNLIAFPLEIIGFNSYKNAQITLGGIRIKEVNLKNMESKIIPGLYLTGELLDVNGECGGYNLGFAWLSGLLAGRGIQND